MEFSSFQNILKLPVCFLFLFATIIVYALAGSPTPDNPGVVEIVIGGFLLLAVLTAGVPKRLSAIVGHNSYHLALQIFFFTGLVLPTVAGAYLGNAHGLVLRDVLAFAFLALPVFLTDIFRTHEKAASMLCRVLIFAGIAFCLRTLIPAFNVWIPQGELLYLSNSPVALFAAVYLAGRLWISLESISRMNVVTVLACLAGLGVLIAAMLLDVQRATIGAVLITWLVMAVYSLIKHPKRLILPVILIGALAAALFPAVADATRAMATKTAEVGLNARAGEAKAVFDTLVAYPPALIVGYGWGSTFESPAVGGLSVNYTHSFLTTMALKGGLIMFAITLAVIVAGIVQVFQIFRQDRVRGLALLWPLMIPALLYASHKSLDYGLILLMIGVWSTGSEPLHKSHSSDKTEEHPNNDKRFHGDR